MKTYLHVTLLLALLFGFGESVRAAPPHAPRSGAVMVVNTSSTGDYSNSYLSLDEAIDISEFGSVYRPLTSGERAQITGCVFDGSGYIAGGCGHGYADTINFALGLFSINLIGPLPTIDDTAPTVIGNSSGLPVMIQPDSSFTYPAYDGIVLDSNNNTVQRIQFAGSPCSGNCGMQSGVRINGDNNLISHVSVWDGEGYGIYINGGASNTLEYLNIGVFSSFDDNCPIGLPSYRGNFGGIYIAASSPNNIIKESAIGCNLGNGIENHSSGTQIGPHNYIGTNADASVNLINFGEGAQSDGTTDIFSNTVGYNLQDGIHLDSSHSRIGGNLIRHNGDSGIQLVGIAANNRIGGPFTGMPYGGNKIGDNGDYGIALVGSGVTGPANNIIAGNLIGTLDGINPAPNLLDGILLSEDTHNNLIGYATVTETAPSNIIGGNTLNGIHLQGGANNNTFVRNYIGRNAFLTLPNGRSGVLIEDNAYSNQIGDATSARRNYIDANGTHGVEISGTSTTNNNIWNNNVAFNSLHGIYIHNSAHANVVGKMDAAPSNYANDIHDNTNNGIRIDSGAHDNTIATNSIYGNDYGIYLSGAGTQHNAIEGALIYLNAYPGIREINSANFNWWTMLSMHDNNASGLGIIKDFAFTKPTIISSTANSGLVTVNGIATPDPGASFDYQVELYRASGDGEGLTYLGSHTTNGSGNWAISFDGAPDCYVAFQTEIASGGTKRSSEFSLKTCPASTTPLRLFLPLILRP